MKRIVEHLGVQPAAEGEDDLYDMKKGQPNGVWLVMSRSGRSFWYFLSKAATRRPAHIGSGAAISWLGGLKYRLEKRFGATFDPLPLSPKRRPSK